MYCCNMWIKENGLAYRSIHDIHYKLTITTEQLFEYCCEVNERKATTEKLATVLNNKNRLHDPN